MLSHAVDVNLTAHFSPTCCSEWSHHPSSSCSVRSQDVVSHMVSRWGKLVISPQSTHFLVLVSFDHCRDQNPWWTCTAFWVLGASVSVSWLVEYSGDSNMLILCFSFEPILKFLGQYSECFGIWCKNISMSDHSSFTPISLLHFFFPFFRSQEGPLCFPTLHDFAFIDFTTYDKLHPPLSVTVLPSTAVSFWVFSYPAFEIANILFIAKFEQYVMLILYKISASEWRTCIQVEHFSLFIELFSILLIRTQI